MQIVRQLADFRQGVVNRGLFKSFSSWSTSAPSSLAAAIAWALPTCPRRAQQLAVKLPEFLALELVVAAPSRLRPPRPNIRPQNGEILEHETRSFGSLSISLATLVSDCLQ